MPSSNTTQHACAPRSRPGPLRIGIAVALGLASQGAVAATIAVTTAADAGTSDTCTLRQAIVSMNIGAVAGTGCITDGTVFGSNDTVTFDPLLFAPGNPNTINLADASSSTLTISDPTLSIDATPNGNVTIQRPRPELDGVNPFGVIYDNAPAGSSLTLTNVTVTNGHVTNSGCKKGGAICAINSNLTLNHCTVTGNIATYAGGIYSRQGNISLNNSLIINNRATVGGGIDTDNGDITAINSTISGNSAPLGAGIVTQFGSVSLSQSTVSNNTGLGIEANSGLATVSIDHSTISGNTGGGIAAHAHILISNSTLSGNSTSSGFGAVSSFYGDLTVNNATFSGNSASYGAAIYIYETNRATSIANTTIAGNNAVKSGGGVLIHRSGSGSVEVDGSIFSSNVGGNIAVLNGNVVANGDHNLIFDGALLNFTFSNAPLGSDPMLSALSPNGGSTQTMVPQPGSSVIDAIPTAACLVTTDQRGVLRPQGVACDIGAVEVVLDRIFADGFEG